MREINIWDSDTIFEKTILWYKEFYENDKKVLTSNDLENYIKDVQNKNLVWSKR